jgi:hypothetical protein
MIIFIIKNISISVCRFNISIFVRWGNKTKKYLDLVSFIFHSLIYETLFDN